MSLGTHINSLLEQLTGRRLMKPPRKASRDRRYYRGPEVFGAIAELRRRHLEGVGDSAVIDLRLAELKVFSQNGEDGVLDTLIRSLSVTDDYFVEFGVEDGTECNTRLLAEVLGWSGLYFEPNDDDARALANRWLGATRVTVVNEAVTPSSIATQFARHGVPTRFGVLSIDVDGQDYWIWEALPQQYEPAIVVIECNTSYPVGEARVEERGLNWSSEFSDSFGASVEALSRLGTRRGYSLVHVDLTGVNAFFVRTDLLRDRQILGVTSRGANYFFVGASHPPHPQRPTVIPS